MKPLRPGEVREYEIATGVLMKFCWMPAGEAQLGSPKVERQVVLRYHEMDMECASIAAEAEEVRGRHSSSGFWLGKYPVTQSEWQAIMGNNPSWFSKDGAGKEYVAGLETARFPVEAVSWEDSAKYLAKLNKHGRAEKVFGTLGKFVLPHEDEWEYACRGGRGNKQAFYFGHALNGQQANCNGNYPYGTETKGPYLGRPTVVGAYESEAPHPWGLCDMHGNVDEWCENLCDFEPSYRAVRGGSWILNPGNCRAALRGTGGPGRDSIVGFRVCFRPD